MINKQKNGTIDSEKFYAGIDAGSVSLNCIVINQKKEIVFEAPYGRHIGRVNEGVLSRVFMIDLVRRGSGPYPLPGTMEKS